MGIGSAERSAAEWALGRRVRPSATIRRERNLLYTGVTRGRKLVVLVGQKKAVAIAIRGVKNRQRWSKLGRVEGGLPSLPTSSQGSSGKGLAFL
jgi:hypothetical protein